MTMVTSINCGGPFNFPFSKDDFCIIGLADPLYKSELIKQINGNSSIISFISSRAIISHTAKIGVGSVIPWVSISNDTNIGKYVTVLI